MCLSTWPRAGAAAPMVVVVCPWELGLPVLSASCSAKMLGGKNPTLLHTPASLEPPADILPLIDVSTQI